MSSSPTGELQAAIARCVESAKSLDTAEVRFDGHPRMPLDRGSRFSLVIAVPGATLPGSQSRLPTAGKIGVSCTIDARLVISADEAHVDPSDWQTQQYVPPSPATWEWNVTPKQAGLVEGTLQLRPVVKVAAGATPTDLTLTTQPFAFTITVTQSASQRLERLAGLVSKYAAAITATAGVVSLFHIGKWPGLIAWLRRRRATTKGRHA
jgi:hypothetical protein